MGAPKQYATASDEEHVFGMNQIAPAPSNEPRVTIIEASPLCSADDLQQDGPDTIPISPKLRATLVFLGMRDEAFSGWETFHVSPAHAMMYFFGSIIALICGLWYIQIFGVPFTRYFYTIPSVITSSVTFIYLCAIWRMGPLVARSRLYMYSLPISWTAWSTTFTVCFLGPLENIPFGSLTHFLVAVGWCLFTGNMANRSGMLFLDHPKHPRTSMLKPLLKSVLFTVRIIDNFTDMSFIRIVMAQKKDHCMWFGEPDNCLIYNIILPCLMVAAVGDLMVSVGMMAISENSRMNKWKKRAIFVMHVISLVFELGIVTVTLLSLLSNMRHPENQSSAEAVEAQSDQVVATIVSLGTTLVTFTVTMVGAGDAVQGLKSIGQRINVIGQRISAAGQRLSAPGQRVSSIGEKMSEAGSVVIRKLSSTG